MSKALLLAIVALHAGLCVVEAMCPNKCLCYVSRGMHMANCMDRGFKEIPKRGSDMYEYVELSDNKLKSLSDNELNVFPIVQVLNLSQNAISELTANVFSGLTYLNHLDLSHNSLRLRHSIHVNFIANNRVTWLSLAGNVHIGRELFRNQLEDEVNATAWIKSDSLRVLSLAGCELTRLPRWLVRGLPAIETLDVSNNQLQMLSMQTLVTTCRLRFIGLGSNKWSCETCDNVRANNYLKKSMVDTVFNYSFCPNSVNYENNCDLQLTAEEEMEKSLCSNTSISERIFYSEPPSLWFYIGIVAGSIVGLVFLSVLVNAVCSSLCKKTRTSPKPRPSTIGDQELLQVLPRS